MMNNFNIKDVQTLKQRFPYMFSGPVISIDFHKGWFPDFVDLCFEIEELLGDNSKYFYWVQIKEKFGGSRMYFKFRSPQELSEDLEEEADGDWDDGNRGDDGDQDDDEDTPASLDLLKAEVRRRIEQTATKLNSECCVCGDPATAAHHGGWIGTLCAYHDPNARHARGDSRFLEELTRVPDQLADDPLGSESK